MQYIKEVYTNKWIVFYTVWCIKDFTADGHFEAMKTGC